MKKIIFTSIFMVFLFACTPYNRIAIDDLGQDRYRYILDFDSRVAQQKMYNLRSNYESGKAGIFALEAIGNSVNTPYQQDTYTTLPRIFQTILLINKTNQVLYADVITPANIDQEHSASIKKIVLPAKKRIILLVASDEPYTITYQPGTEGPLVSYDFLPRAEKKLLVKLAGINPTEFY